MEEFKEENYEEAISLADQIYAGATRIRNVFENIDNVMNLLHGGHWESSGSEDVNAEYVANVKSRFEPFYESVVTMKQHIYEVTGRNQEADAQAAATIEG